MMATIAVVAILSAILVFFADEFLAYARAMVAKPFVFLGFTVVLASALIVMFGQWLLSLVIRLWIVVLELVIGVAQCFWFNYGAEFLAKWLVLVVLSVIPVAVAYGIASRKKRKSQEILNRGIEIGVIIWVILVLFYVLGLPGSDFSG